MQQQSNKVIHYGIMLLIYGTALATLFTHTVAHALSHGGHEADAAAYSCKTTGTVVTVTLRNNAFSPATVHAGRCDILLITNKDDRPHLVALGPHSHHADYPGFAERVLLPGQTSRTVLAKPGDFSMHDHLDAAIEGELDIAAH